MKIPEFVFILSRDLTHVSRHRTSSAYISTLRRLTAYYGSSDISFCVLSNKEFLKSFEEHLLCDGLSRNSVSFYMRMLRSIYNQAVSQGIAEFVPGLFEHVFTGIEPTPKRAIEPETIQTIFSAKLSLQPALADARDLFMLSFCLQGIPFVDLAYLKKSDMRNGLLTYRRKKTGGLITVAVVPQAEEIIRKYAPLTEGSPYLLPIIMHPGENEYSQYQTALSTYNRRLKTLGSFLNLGEKLTSYVARHSWATTAYHNGVPTSIISQGLGHRTEEITRIYLASFNENVIRNANNIILAAITGRNQRENKPQISQLPVRYAAGYGDKNNARHFTSDRQLLVQT